MKKVAIYELTAPQLLVNYAYSVIPSGGGPTGKAPLIPWEDYQHKTPELEDIQAWDQQFKPSLWGIVTGAISCIVVIDIDNPELRSMFDKAGLLPHIQTPRGGFHYWFRHPGRPIKTIAGLLPGIDVRADGGFVNVIGRRRDGEYKVLISPSPDSIYPWDKLPKQITRALNGQRPQSPPIEGQIIPEHKRNATLTRIAGGLRAKGLSQEAIEAALQAINSESCKPPLEETEVASIARSVAKYPPTNGYKDNKPYTYYPNNDDMAMERDRSVTDSVTKAQDIKDYVTGTHGWFSYEEMDKELGIRHKRDKDNRRQVMKRLKADGIVEAHNQHNKLFRYVNVAVRLIDFKAAGKRTPLAIRYPFSIENYFATYSRNVVVLAGVSNAGKTAFLLNFIRLNMADFSIYYQSSEMGDAELANRLLKFEDLALEDWNFVPEERSSDFADVIRPDCINIIDYMEVTENFYMVAGHIKQIHEKLRSGIAVIALQKKQGAKLGRGGDFGLEKARLYLSMDAGKLTIHKAKNWANPELNPNGLVLGFKLVNGCKFSITTNWHQVEE